MPTAQRFPQKLTQKSDSFLQELLPSVHANSNKNTDPPNRAELIVRPPGELKEFKNIQNMSLHQKQAGVQMTFSFLHSLPTKFMPCPRWDPLHTQPLHRALSSSACNSFFQQGEHHQTGVFSGFATKLRLTWKWPRLGHLSLLPGENVLVLCHWDGTILDYNPEHRIRDSQVHKQTCSWADLQ